MTTAVTVDAHAGWPVQVCIQKRLPGSGTGVRVVEVELVRVEPHTSRVFYVYDGQSIEVSEDTAAGPVPAPPKT